ncbi:hypothetical protein BA939_19950 [Rhizobium sp. S41]|nr:hypothetical protein BA939_19950 [Rhizobium sp. S41]KGE80310.1 hypothetical protein LW14_23810 [Rhizobium sp. H41]
MAVLVSDTSVLIDLERSELLDEMFLLPCEFAVPDLLHDRELAGELGDRLVGLGLKVVELTSTELGRATAINRQYARLSTPDSFAFTIAQSRKWGLLTGDSVLRDLALAEQVEMHGVLWLFDQLADGAHVETARLHRGLSILAGHPRCRLPVTEMRKRLTRFSTG